MEHEESSTQQPRKGGDRASPYTASLSAWQPSLVEALRALGSLL